jgi:hypothetical protein
MDTILIKDLLSEEDLKRVREVIKHEFATRPREEEYDVDDTNHREDTVIYWKKFGRIDIRSPKIPQDIIDKVFNIVSDLLKDQYPDLVYSFVIYAEYSRLSGGHPRLGAHFDKAEASTFILDYQLDSNCSWEIGVEDQIFNLEDNSGILFDPLDKIHYRPNRFFKADEFVRMIFFRFDTSIPMREYTEADWLRLNQTSVANGDSV